jgi:prolyl-tRNA editing enzyme YbaK/EbsC (Cys-tRNA(Pro) deacylase)
MTYHPVTRKITDLLTAKNFWFETFEHEPVRTSEEAVKVRTGYTLSQGAKALIVRVKISNHEKKFAMLVMPADKRFDDDKVKAIFAAKDIRFATVEEVAETTGGVEVGGVPPFGHLFGLETIADPKLFENEKIVFNAGDRRFSVAMKTEDYKNLARPRIEPFILI